MTTVERRTFDVVAQVVALLDARATPNAIVGAVALAAHGYVRATANVDIGVNLGTLRELDELGGELRAALPKANVAVRWPDADDPLGGVIDISASDMRLVQVINFVNPLGLGDHPGREGVMEAMRTAPVGGLPRVVNVPYLVAIKLHTGGSKSAADVVELLDANDTPLPAIDAICARFRLTDAWSALRPEIAARRAG